MKRKLYFNNKPFIQDVQTLKHKNFFPHKLKEEYANEIAKVYEINTRGKFTVIVRSSFLRLHTPSTTNINPCYLYDLSSICDSEGLLQSNLNNDRYLNRHWKRRKWKLLHEKIGKLIMKNKKSIKDQISSTFIVSTSTTQTKHSPVIIQQGDSYYGFYAFLFIISVIIFGFILWYIFIKTSQSPKSTIRLAYEDSDSDDNHNNNNNQYKIRRLDNYNTDLNSSQINKTVDSLFFDDDNDSNYSERKSTDSMSFNNIRNQHEKISYENIQMLIQNLQQSDLESINSSIIGQILSDLIHHAVNIANSNLDPQPSTDFLTFLSYAPQFFHILRTIISNKSSSELLNPTNFLQCQYLIDILHNSEFILEYLHRHHSQEKVFLVKILTHLYQILLSMNNNSCRHQYICQSLVDILEKLNTKQSSSTE